MTLDNIKTNDCSKSEVSRNIISECLQLILLNSYQFCLYWLNQSAPELSRSLLLETLISCAGRVCTIRRLESMS